MALNKKQATTYSITVWSTQRSSVWILKREKTLCYPRLYYQIQASPPIVFIYMEDKETNYMQTEVFVFLFVLLKNTFSWNSCICFGCVYHSLTHTLYSQKAGIFEGTDFKHILSSSFATVTYKNVCLLHCITKERSHFLQQIT